MTVVSFTIIFVGRTTTSRMDSLVPLNNSSQSPSVVNSNEVHNISLATNIPTKVHAVGGSTISAHVTYSAMESEAGGCQFKIITGIMPEFLVSKVFMGFVAGWCADVTAKVSLDCGCMPVVKM